MAQRVVMSGQDTCKCSIILPAKVANHNAEFGSSHLPDRTTCSHLIRVIPLTVVIMATKIDIVLVCKTNLFLSFSYKSY